MKKRLSFAFIFALGLIMVLTGCKDSKEQQKDNSWDRKSYEVVYENYDDFFKSNLNDTNNEVFEEIQDGEEQIIEEQLNEVEPTNEQVEEERLGEEQPK